jgi:hypothetical protein
MQSQLSDYLYARTSGHMGSLMTLINRACSRAIRTGVEALTFDVLESTKIDVAAERARSDEEAAIRAQHRDRAKRKDRAPTTQRASA